MRSTEEMRAMIGAKSNRRPSKVSRVRCSEADVQKACTDLLKLDGWRAIRTDPTSDKIRGKGFGELGMPDYLYLRYWPPKHLWIEYKAPGAKPKTHQLDWHAVERASGALVLVVDSIDDFMLWYVASGLARKVLK